MSIIKTVIIKYIVWPPGVVSIELLYSLKYDI